MLGDAGCRFQEAHRNENRGWEVVDIEYKTTKRAHALPSTLPTRERAASRLPPRFVVNLSPGSRLVEQGALDLGLTDPLIDACRIGGGHSQ